MKKPTIIAIDGPAASGKSTLGERLAKELGYLFFDTGVMYRAVTWAVLNAGIDVNDEVGVSRLAEEIKIDVLPPTQNDGRLVDVQVNGTDITWEIRTAEVEASVSPVAAYYDVRIAMVAQQRRIGLNGNVVMVGRDIGTVVLPEAELKIYLEASAEERAKRRYQEIIHRGKTAHYEEILDGIRQRDLIDSNREFSPLKPAVDAVIIDSDHMSIEEVLKTVIKLVGNG